MLQRPVKTQNVTSRPALLSGFTIVELLIVIVVIGILSSITVVAFTGIQKRATTAAYMSSVDGWEKLIRAEYAATGTIPTPPFFGFTCLGNSAANFPVNSELGAGVCAQLIGAGGDVTNYMYDQPYVDVYQFKPNFKNGLLPQIKRQSLPGGGSLVTRGILALTNVHNGIASVKLVWYPEQRDACARGIDLWSVNAGVESGGCVREFTLE